LEDKIYKIDDEYIPQQDWNKWNIETNICKLFRMKYAM